MTGNDQTPEELTPKQERFLAALLAGNAIVVAAKVAGISERTAHMWLKLPYVQSEYKAAKQALFDESLSLLMSGIEDAVKGIKDIAKDDEVQPQTRLRAYQIWLEQAIELHKMSELESRLAELEQLIKSSALEK